MQQLVQNLRDLDLVNTAVRYNPVFVRGVRAAVQQYQAADASRRRELRDGLIARTLKRAAGTPYGKQFGQSLSGWPVLDKELVRSDPTQFLNAKFLKIGAGTGGTTGTPLQLYRSLSNIAAERYFIEQLLFEHGLDLRRAKIVILRADEVKDPEHHEPPFGVYKNRGQTLVLSNAHLNKNNLPWFAAELEAFQPAVIYVYPSMLENLLALLAETSTELSIPIALSSSEMVNASLFETVARQLGGQLIDYYGQGERVAFASATQRDTYYFDPVYGEIELLAVDEESGMPGYTACKVVATGHWNSAMPLVRYDTGDFAVVRDEDLDKLDRISGGELPFLGIKGRTSEYLLGPDGEVVSGLNHLPRGVSHLLRMQVVQDSPTAVCFRLAVEEDFSAADEETLLGNARALLPSAMTIDIQRNAVLERGKNGKIPFVIRRMPGQVAD